MKEENPFKTDFSDKFSNNFLKQAAKLTENIFFKLLGVKKLEKYYFDAVKNKSNKNASEMFLYTLKVNYKIEEGSLKNIPKEGPVVIVANHPFGCLEGLIMLDLLIKQRPNAKVLANYILERLPEGEFTEMRPSKFEGRLMKDGLILLSYDLEFTAVGETVRSKRTSIWRKEASRWEMLFHQSTLKSPV